MNTESLRGSWVVGPWTLGRAARVTVEGPQARVAWPGTDRDEVAVSLLELSAPAGPAGRWEVALDDGRGAARAWLRELPASAAGTAQAWLGALVSGGPLLRARRLGVVPEALCGAWVAAPLGDRSSRRALGWQIAGDSVEIRRLGRVVSYTGLWLAGGEGGALGAVLVDDKGVAVELRLWPVGGAWLVCETDRSLTYLLHREGAEPPPGWVLEGAIGEPGGALAAPGTWDAAAVADAGDGAPAPAPGTWDAAAVADAGDGAPALAPADPAAAPDAGDGAPVPGAGGSATPGLGPGPDVQEAP
jgi:hypothetical protein